MRNELNTILNHSRFNSIDESSSPSKTPRAEKVDFTPNLTPSEIILAKVYKERVEALRNKIN
jgi:hypothetical protein